MANPHFKKAERYILTWLVGVTLGMALSLPAAADRPTAALRNNAATARGSTPLPAGINSADWQAMRAQVRAAQSRPHFDDATGEIRAHNRTQRLRVRHTADGATEVAPDDGSDWQFSLTLVGIGDAMRPTYFGRPTLRVDGNDAHFDWSATVHEWWTHGAAGLEQWFRLDQPPAERSDGAPLQVRLRMGGGLAARLDGERLLMRGRDGRTHLSYSKLVAWDADGRPLISRMSVAGTELTLNIDDHGARYPVTIDPLLVQEGYLKAANAESNDQFGNSIAISGDTVVVGAVGEDSNGSSPADNSASLAGAVYVFVRSGTTWTQQAYLKAANAESNDQFGNSVAISGDTVVVGARLEDGNGSSPADNSAPDAGAAYVFVRSGTTWTQQAYLKAANAESNDQFGNSVAISGDTMVVGAYAEDGNGSGPGDNSATNAGAAYVFVRSGAVWTQQAYLKAANAQSVDLFGYTVAISGDTVVVGAPNEDSNGSAPGDNSASNAGAAYVFVRSGAVWTQQAYLKAVNAESNDSFGYVVAASGDTVVVGAPGEASNGSSPTDNSAPKAGAAYVFVRSGATWTQQAYLKAANAESNDQFGYSVAISGDSAVVGAPAEASNGSSPTDNSAPMAGAAYVFVRSGATWTQQAYLKAGNAESGDFFGFAVATSGNTVVVGAPNEDGNGSGPADNSAANAGAAYVFATRYTVTASVAAGNGTIAPPSQIVLPGASAGGGLAPASGWHVGSLAGDTCSPVDNGAGTWAAPAIGADCAVTASFVANPPPVANAQSVAVAHNGAASITLTGSDSYPNGAFTFAIVDPPAHGTITGFDANTGNLTYTAVVGYAGADSFTFTVNDGNGTSLPATVSITISAGVPPVATAQSVAVAYGTATTITLTASDANPGGPFAFSFALATPPAHGAVTIGGDVATYAPAAGYSGPDSFTFTASTVNGTSLPATVSITISAGVPPVATAQSVAVAYGTATTITLTASDANPGGPFAFSFALATPPAHGTVTIGGDVATYAPAAGYSGPDSFTFTASTVNGTSLPATVSITVHAAPAVVPVPAFGTTGLLTLVIGLLLLAWMDRSRRR